MPGYILSCLFENSHFHSCEVINISLWFCFAFPRWLVLLSTSSCICWSFVSLLWKNIYSDLLPIFKLDYFFFSYWVAWVLDVNRLSDKWFANMLTHFVGWVFILLIISFTMQKIFSVIWFHLFIFAFVACASVSYPKR